MSGRPALKISCRSLRIGSIRLGSFSQPLLFHHTTLFLVDFCTTNPMSENCSTQLFCNDSDFACGGVGLMLSLLLGSEGIG